MELSRKMVLVLLLMNIIAQLFLTQSNTLFAQDINLEYEFDLKEGCGGNLNKTAVDLQNKGLTLPFVKENMDMSIELLEHAIELEPRLFPSYVHLKNYYLYYRDNELPKAIALMKKGIENCPNEPLLYFGLAHCYTHIGQYQNAIDNYNKSLKFWIKPPPSVFYNLGNNYAKVKMYDRAIENFTKAIDIDPNFARAYNNRGFIYRIRLNNQAKGCEDWEKACALGDCEKFLKAKKNGYCYEYFLAKKIINDASKDKLISLYQQGKKDSIDSQDEAIGKKTTSINKIKIAITTISTINRQSDEMEIADNVNKILYNSLGSIDRFLLLDPASYLGGIRGTGTELNDINYMNWKIIGAQMLIAGSVEITSPDNLKIMLRLFDTSKSSMLLGRNYEGSTSKAEKMVNSFCTEIMSLSLEPK